MWFPFPEEDNWRTILWILVIATLFTWGLMLILRLTPDPSVECLKIPGATWSSNGGGYCLRESPSR